MQIDTYYAIKDDFHQIQTADGPLVRILTPEEMCVIASVERI